MNAPGGRAPVKPKLYHHTDTPTHTPGSEAEVAEYMRR